MDHNTINVATLGCCFFVIFCACSGAIEKTLLTSAHDDNPDFDVDGYTFLGGVFSSFAVSLWFAPSAVSLIGPRLTMCSGAALYTFTPIAIYFEEATLLYLAGCLDGFGSALLWTGSSNYLILNSTEKTLARNTGLFWILYQSGHLAGNLFLFYAFRGLTLKIDEATRHLVLFGMVGALTTGTLMFFLLRREHNDGEKTVNETPVQALKKAWVIAKSRNTAILIAAFGYCGLHMSFVEGVYGASIGFTLQFGEGVKQLTPLSSILKGFGEVSGGLLVKFFGDVNVFRINLFFVLAVVGNCSSYLVVFLSLPANANFGNTYDHAIIEPRLWLLLLASFLFGMGNCFVHTQLTTLVGSLYPKDSAPAFCVFRFSLTLFTAASFYYSRYLTLHTQLFILITFGILGMITFNVMNAIHERKQSAVKN